MIDDTFRIYIDQLRDGQVEHIKESLSPDFLGVNEPDLKFADPVVVCGEVYLADSILMLHLDVNTVCQIPCRICNELVRVDIALQKVYLPISTDEIKGAIFDFREVLREVILLEVPLLAECEQGTCPERKTVQKYLTQETASNHALDDRYHPFRNL